MKTRKPYDKPLFAVLQVCIEEDIMNVISGNIEDSPIGDEGDPIDAF